jgi:trans-2,3-dihydro-3-hydroxyanthranilate isomerase
MGRPSTLECELTARSGEVAKATVSGHVVPIAKGEMTIPPFIG